jgi:sortase A
MAKFEISNVVHKPDIRGTISLIGRGMITLGLILLLFVAYQLWGTNVFEARSQKTLKKQFAQKLQKAKHEASISSTTTPGSTPDNEEDNPTVTTPALSADVDDTKAKDGDPIAIIKIDKIGLNHVVVEGTNKGDLQKGPGHYNNTPLPGQQGNAAIAGHRTTYGAPFNRLDELKVGDKIVLETVRGTFTYEVSKDPYPVRPSDVSVINPEKDPSDPTGNKLLAELTLTTCHPKYSAAQRLIIKAKISDADASKVLPADQLKDQNGNLPHKIDIGDDDTQNISGIGHSNILVAMGVVSFHLPLLWWMLALVVVGCIWWYFFRRFHNWKVWIAGVLPFAVVLLLYFIHLEHALPSNI